MKVSIILLGFCFALCHCDDSDPLYYHYDPKEPNRVAILWNPTQNIRSISNVQQRAVTYKWSDDEKKPKAEFGAWRELVNETAGHTALNRYTFVLDDHCSELDFKVSFLKDDGSQETDIVQTLQPMPRPTKLGTKLSLGNMDYDASTGLVSVSVSYDAKLTATLEAQKISDFTGHLHLQGCETVWNNEVADPIVEDEGKTIKIPSEYATHGCTFTYSLGFDIFDKANECKSRVQSDDSESITLPLSCELIPKLECGSPQYNCDMNCEPTDFEINANHSIGSDNRTIFDAVVKWNFDHGAKLKDLKEYRIKYYHTWFLYKNQPTDNTDEGKATVAAAKSLHLFKPQSVTDLSRWILQVCAIYSPCDTVNWASIPQYPIRYYPLHDVEPVWPEPEVVAPVAPKVKPQPVKQKQKPSGEKASPEKDDQSAEKTKRMAAGVSPLNFTPLFVLIPMAFLL